MYLLFSGLYLMAWEPKDLHGPSSPGEAPRTYTEHCGEDLCNKPRISVELVGHALRSDPGSDLQRLLSLSPSDTHACAHTHTEEGGYRRTHHDMPPVTSKHKLYLEAENDPGRVDEILTEICG